VFDVAVVTGDTDDVADDGYLHGHHDSVLRSHRWRTVDNSAAYLRPDLLPGTTVLDVGCGPGTITAEMARLAAPGIVVGIDAGEGVLDEARAVAADAGVDNVEFRPGDVYDLPFDDGSFDVVHAHQVLQHLADPVAALVEMGRVCRTGGVVAARDGDYGAMTFSPDDADLSDALGAYRAAAAVADGDCDAGRRLFGWALAAGFSEVVPSASVWCFATPQDRAWWGDLWAERFTASPLAARLLRHGLAAPADLDRYAAGWRRWAAQPDGWFAVLNGEVRCRP
jgi:SAM-dependent methyltransferase